MGEYSEKDAEALQGNDLIPTPQVTPESYVPWDMKRYMSKIEDAIATATYEIGAGRTPQERDVLRRRLAENLVGMSLELSNDLHIGGDFNIAFMYCMGLLCSAWSTFIIEAKSLNPVYPKKARRDMHVMAHSQLRTYRAMLEEALRLGDVYTKEGRWGVPNVTYSAYYYCPKCDKEIHPDDVGFLNDRVPRHIARDPVNVGWWFRKKVVHFTVSHDLEVRHHERGEK